MDISNQALYIIVLGHLMDSNGRLDKETTERVNLATKLDGLYEANRIVLCGWAYRFDVSISIAEAMKRNISLNRPDLLPKIKTQPDSRDTVGDAFFSRVALQYVYNAQKPRIVVVTSQYHVKRSSEIFEFVFHGYANTVVVKGCNERGDDCSRLLQEERSREAFKRTFSEVNKGDMRKIHNAMIDRHPLYNGDVYPAMRSLESIVEKLRLEDAGE